MTQDIELELPTLLPEAPDESDACVQRLTAGLLDRDGIESVHVVLRQNEEPAKLCIHYSPSVISLQRIRELTASLGAQLTDTYAHFDLETEGISRFARAGLVEQRLREVEGVVEAHVSPTGVIRVEFDRERASETEFEAVLTQLGVRRRPRPARSSTDQQLPGKLDDHGQEKETRHAHGGIFGARTELIYAISCAGALALGWTLSLFAGVASLVPIGFYVLGYFFGGYYTLKEAIQTIRAGRFEIDFLMLLAAAGAAGLGELAEGVLLLALFSIGHALESYAMGRARRAIEALADLAPTTAIVRRAGVESQIAVEDLRVGELIVIRPNARIPADGIVIAGQSSVDQAAITGESIPVDKRPIDALDPERRQSGKVAPEHRIYAGTVNGSGALEVEVTRLSKDSALARVVRMVSEAQTQISPTQRFTDRFQRIFVPAVLALVVLLLFAGLVINEPFSATLYRALAVLVAASPCALAISTPSAVLSGLARAARGGVLIKGGGPLENLGSLTAIAFDKTGTLTEGKPELTDVVVLGDATESSLLTLVVAVEAGSDHPLAAAVVQGGRKKIGNAALPPVSDLTSITGRGVWAKVQGDLVHIGKRELFVEADGAPLPDDVADAVERLEAAGRTTMVVRRGNDYLGVLGLMDTPRPAAARVITRLREAGIRRMIMISGDNQRVADAISAQVGLTEAWGNLLPEDKVAAIRKLRDQEQKVAMVGDGVNDAPAMANSTVGIAMGAAGSDVAMETADVALMGDDLERLPFAVDLSRQSSRIIRQNLFASLGVVAVLIPATIFGVFGISLAILVHEGSTLLVVSNALRLLAYRENQPVPTSRAPRAQARAELTVTASGPK